jgi:hypothetical protein
MRKVIGRNVWRAVRRVLVLVGLILLLLFGTGVAVVVQGGRDDTQRADTAILMADGTALSVTARTDRVIELYLKGAVSHIVVVGRDPGLTEAVLLSRGVQQVKLQTAQAPSQVEQMAVLRTMLRQRPTELAGLDAVLIAEPVEVLRLLKIAHDHDLPLRGAPTSSTSMIDLGAVLDEVGRYFAYVVRGR